MKKLFGVLFLAMVVICVYAAVPGLAEDNGEGLSDYVHASLGSGPRLNIAPGTYGHIAARADAFLANAHRTIFAEDLKKRKDAGESLFILDIRLKADYDTGHVPGSVNIEFAKLAKPENLALLPADGTPIVIVCYTGHTASQANAILNVLGYNAWTLRFGMMSWRKGEDNSDPTMRKNAQKIWSSSKSQVIYGAGYPIEISQ